MFNAVLQLQSIRSLARLLSAPHFAQGFLALAFVLTLLGTPPVTAQDAVPIDVFVSFRGPDGRPLSGPGLVALRWYDYNNQVEPMCYPGSSLHLRLWPGAYWIYAHLNENLAVRELVETDANRNSFFGAKPSDSPTGGVVLNIPVMDRPMYLEFRMEPGSADRADVEQYCNPAGTSSLDIDVDDADTGLPLHDVPVIVRRIQDGAVVAQGLTNRDGRTGPLAVPATQGAAGLGEYRIEAGFANAERTQPQGYFAYEPRWSDVPPELLTVGATRNYSVSLRRDGPAPEEVIVVTPREEGICPTTQSPEEWYLQVDENAGLPGPHRILHDQYYLDEGVTIHPGQRIATPLDLAGSALLALRPAALVSLEGGTVFSVPCSLAPGEDNNIGMSVGGAYFEVQQIQGTEVEVYTRTAITSTRGTKFRVGATDAATEVAVFEGTVEVTPTNRSLSSQFVQTGQSVTVLSESVGPLGSAGPAPVSLQPSTNTAGPATATAPVSQQPPTNTTGQQPSTRSAGPAAPVSLQSSTTSAGPVVPSSDVTLCGYRLSGAMHARWSHLNGQALLGCPTMSEVAALGSPQGSQGTWANFEHGLMTVMSAGPRPGSSYEVHGVIKNLYYDMQGSGSYLGFPLTDEYDAPGGRRSDFEGGYILWTSADNTARAYRYGEGPGIAMSPIPATGSTTSPAGTDVEPVLAGLDAPALVPAPLPLPSATPLGTLVGPDGTFNAGPAPASTAAATATTTTTVAPLANPGSVAARAELPVIRSLRASYTPSNDRDKCVVGWPKIEVEVDGRSSMYEGRNYHVDLLVSGYLSTDLDAAQIRSGYQFERLWANGSNVLAGSIGRWQGSLPDVLPALVRAELWVLTDASQGIWMLADAEETQFNHALPDFSLDPTSGVWGEADRTSITRYMALVRGPDASPNPVPLKLDIRLPYRQDSSRAATGDVSWSIGVDFPEDGFINRKLDRPRRLVDPDWNRLFVSVMPLCGGDADQRNNQYFPGRPGKGLQTEPPARYHPVPGSRL